MANEREVVKTIADAIVKASKAITEQNNKSYIDNKLKYYTGGSSSGSGGGGSISGTIPASQVTGLYNTVAGYIINAQASSDAGDVVAGKIMQTLNGIANMQISTASIGSAQINNLDVAVANIVHLTTQQATIEDATIRQLKADIANVGLSNIGTANIGYAQVKDLVSGTAIFREAASSKLFIDRLAVTDANMVSLTTGELMLKNANGEFVRIVVDAQGNVSGEVVTFDGDDVFNDNSLTATKIVENSITARELNVEAIFSDRATIGAIKAANIDVADLFANTAFVNRLYASTIQAPNAGTDIDISGNSQITLLKNRLALLVEDESTSTEIILTPGMLDAITDHVNVIADTIDLSANTSIDARVKTVVDEEIGYHMDMLSTSDILSDAITSTTLSIALYRGKDNVTNATAASKFDWTRKSGNSSADTVWNNSHKGMKSITINRNDLDYSATFECTYTDTDTVLATASKGIVDRSDGKVLVVSLGYNLPPTQIVDVNDNTYSPDWSSTNLIVTPIVTEDQQAIQLSDSGLTVTWKRRAGSGSETNIVSGETVTNKVLTVSENVLSSITSGLVTYIAYVTYTHSDGSVSTAKSESTFSQIKSGRDATLREVRIEGEQVFKYATAASTPSPESIRLVAVAEGCTITGWHYRASNGNWVEYPTNLDNQTASTDERYIHDTDPVFVDNVATIRVSTNYTDVYDIFSVYKVYDGAKGDQGDDGEPGEDGAPGDPAPVVFLTNENITFSGDKLGRVASTAINCNVIAYIGTTKVKPIVGNVSGMPTGMTVSKIDAGNNEISVNIQVASNATLGGVGQQFGALTVPITYPVATNLSITWSKVNTGADGEAGKSAVTFVSYAPYGTVFTNNTGSLLIQTSAYDGAAPITTQQASYVWARFVSGQWQIISGETTESLTVNGSSVDGVASFRCAMTYQGETYYTTLSLTDKTDNFQAEIESSSGNIFKNAQGQSTLKCRLFQNAKEVDSTGVRYTCWWYRLDKDGNNVYWDVYDNNSNVVDTVARKSGKSIVVTDKDVTIKNTFLCEVEDQTLAESRIITSAQFTIVDMSDPVQSGIEPQNPEVDMLWIDTSVTPNQFKRWNGTEWVSVSDVDSEALSTRLTTIETEIREQGGEILLRATKEEVEQIDDRVTASETQISQLDVKYDGISAVVARKATNYRQTQEPQGANFGDIWVQPITTGPLAGTEKSYQAVGAAGSNTPSFAYDDDGNLLYMYPEDSEYKYPIAILEDDTLAVQGEGAYEIDEDGQFIGYNGWKEIKADSVASLEITVNGINTAVQNLNGDISLINQRADSIENSISSVDGRVTDLSLDLDGITASVSSLDTSVSGLSSDIITMTGNIENIENDINDLSGDIEDTNANLSLVSQQANKINWLVASGTSAATMQLTSEALSAIANNINLQANNTVRITSGDQITASAANSIDLSGNNSISLITENLSFRIDEVSDVTNKVNRWMVFSEDGLRQGKEGSTYSTLVDDTGFHILQKNEKITTIAKRQVAAEEFRVGRINTTETRCVIREAGDNGLIITVEGLA